MQTSQPPVWARDHTLLGICEALGEDFGFNPLFLRVPLAALLLINPLVVIGTYAALGTLVLVSRLLIPNPSIAAAAPAAEPAARQAGNDSEADMALAA
jgi:phage shock protein PspC (stress-responsive transcriptional regulator)